MLSEKPHLYGPKHWFSSWFTRKEKAYILKARLSFKNNVVYDSDVSPHYCAIQTKLYNIIIADGQSSQDYTIDEHKINGQVVKFVCINDKYEISPGIMIKHLLHTERSEKEEFDYHTYKFEITDKSGIFANVISFIGACVEEYDMVQLDELPQQICSLNGFMGKDAMPTYNIFPYTSTKTFDNMYFENKDTLLAQLEYFINNRETYVKLGIPYTQAFLFHGVTGTGKTSCAKSIAEYTKRHVILVSLSKIKTARQFSNLFLEKYTNHLNIPINKKLFIFDDFECKGWKDVIKPRTEQVTTIDTTHTELANTIKEVINSNREGKDQGKDHKFTDNEPITLGDILETLDGFIEMNGRIMIFMTNFPKALDPALLRHGRIDINMEFKKMLKADVNKMYKLWFNKSIPSLVYAKMRDYAFTQAEIGSIFKQNDADAVTLSLY